MSDQELSTYPTEAPAPVLRRSRSDRIVAGVCGGLAHYTGVDPAIVRIALVVLVLAGFGLGIVAYILGWILIPEERPGETVLRPPAVTSDTLRVAVGTLLIALGVIALAGKLLPAFLDRSLLAPLALIAVGAVVLISGARR